MEVVTVWFVWGPCVVGSRKWVKEEDERRYEGEHYKGGEIEQ
jgi:hypothetical protein